jgi:hypothetical protein
LFGRAKKEHTSVPTVSLHVHERIDSRTIIEAVRKRNGVPLKPAQGYFFESREENPPLREAVDFYRHPRGWTNRLIAGDFLDRNLKAEIDPDLIEHYCGTISLPFAAGEHTRAAVKVIDDRSIESLKVLSLG